MKKFCDGCWALHAGRLPGRGYTASCSLGYKMEIRHKKVPPEAGKGEIPVPTPLEECPKPRTRKEWANLPMKVKET